MNSTDQPPARIPLRDLRVTGTPLENALNRVVNEAAAQSVATTPAFSSSI